MYPDFLFLFPGDEEWSGQQRDGSTISVQWSASGQEVSLMAEDYQPLYFVAPGTKPKMVLLDLLWLNSSP